MGFNLGGFLSDAAKVAGISVKVNPHIDAQVLGAASGLIKQGQTGFNTAVNALKQATNPAQLNALRNRLNGLDKKGFDLATALHIGMSKATAPAGMHPTAQAGFYINHGITVAPPSVKTMAVQQVSADPNAKAGAVVSAQAIVKASWWKRFLVAIHLSKKA